MTRTNRVLMTFDIHAYPGAQNEVHLWIEKTLEVLASLSIKASFFIPAAFAEQVPAHVLMIVKDGHEIGCHGMTHGDGEEYNVLPYERQKDMLAEAKKRIEAIAGQAVISFRAPAFKISGATVKALEESGFKADLSVTSQRLGLLSSDVANIGWLYSPRSPYHPDYRNPFKRGSSSLWEIPPSAFILPFSSNLIIASGGTLIKLFFKILSAESRLRKNPIVYMAHPEEVYPRDIKYNYEFRWKHLLPSKKDGFILRYILLHNKDGKKISRDNINLMKLMKATKNVAFVTVKEMVEVLEKGQ